MKILAAILLCLSLSGCALHAPPVTGYQTRMMCVDYVDQAVDVDWIKPGNPDRCGTTRFDFGRWEKMTEDDVFKEIVSGVNDSDVRFGAECAKKGR